MKSLFTRFSFLLIVIALFASPALATTMSVPVHAATEPVTSTVKDATKEFKSLSRHERRSRVKDAKKALRQFKADKKAGHAADDTTVLLVILAILLPPLAVYLYEGEINNRFWLSLVLTLLFWIPGVIYALLVVLGEI